MTFGPVRRSTTVPVASDFAGPDAPLVVNGATGGVYAITDAGAVVAVLAAAQQAAVADATDAGTVITQLNSLLAKLRTVGIIAT